MWYRGPPIFATHEALEFCDDQIKYAIFTICSGQSSLNKCLLLEFTFTFSSGGARLHSYSQLLPSQQRSVSRQVPHIFISFTATAR